MKNSILTIVSVILVIVVAMFIFTGGGNKVASLLKYFCIFCFFLGLASPKFGVYILALITVYIDTLKRIAVFDGIPSQLELYSILGVGPILVCSIFIGQVYRNRGLIKIDRTERICFIWAMVLVLVNTAIGVGFGNARGGVEAVANGAAYCTLVYTIPSIFLKNRGWVKLMSFILAIFIPSVLYMFYQHMYGLADYEVAYLLSGLTQEYRVLDEAVPRLFSTMNSAGNYSSVVSLLAVCWLLNFNTGTFIKSNPLKFIVGVFMAIIFAWSCYYTLSRGGWVGGLGVILALIIFRGRKSAAFCLSAGTAVFLFLFLASGFILDNGYIADMTESLSTSDGGMSDGNVSAGMATRLGTFEGRLESLRLTLEEPKRWSPFGLMFRGITSKDNYGGGEVASGSDRSLYYVHDSFSDLLLRIGYIPLFFLIIFAFKFVMKLSTQIALSRYHPEKASLRIWVCLCFGIFIGYFANPAQIRTFPVNFYFYLFLGMLIGVYIRPYETKEESV